MSPEPLLVLHFVEYLVAEVFHENADIALRHQRILHDTDVGFPGLEKGHGNQCQLDVEGEYFHLQPILHVADLLGALVLDVRFVENVQNGSLVERNGQHVEVLHEDVQVGVDVVRDHRVKEQQEAHDMRYPHQQDHVSMRLNQRVALLVVCHQAFIHVESGGSYC